MINYFSKKNKHSLYICEDLKTSLIFELLIQLDSKKFSTILSKACDNTFDDFGRIECINFWPRWKNPKGTNNKLYIEPDVFIRCENIDIIIEAKKDLNNSQTIEQWNDQITAYINEYSSDKKEYVLIAVDGNLSLHSKHNNICKTSWERIYNAILGIQEQLPDYKYNLFSYAFQLIGITPYNSIDDFLKKHPKVTTINFSLLDFIKL